MATHLPSRVLCCSQCRRLQCFPVHRDQRHQGIAPRCSHCAASDSELIHVSGNLAVLVAGTGMLTVRYPGDVKFVRRMLMGIGALVVVSAFCTGSRASSLAVMGALAGVAAAALADARRAALLANAMKQMPVTPPPTGRGGRHSLDTDNQDPENDETGAITGVAEAVERVLDAPLMGRECMAVRVDLRARRKQPRALAHASTNAQQSSSGDDAQLVAQWIDNVPFAVRTEHGAQVLVTGTVHIEAFEYDIVEPSEQADFHLGGIQLLPAAFGPHRHDGWACEIALRPGDRVEVHGRLSGDLFAPSRGGSYRDAEIMDVVRGTPENPVHLYVQRQ